MKKLLLTFNLLMLFLLSQINLNAQWNCLSSSSATLNDAGLAWITPDVLTENNGSEVLLISKDSVNFTESLLFDCLEIGSNEVFVIDEVNNIGCSLNVTIFDIDAPTPYCTGDVTLAFGPADEPAIVGAIDFNIGSFDNCTLSGDLRYTFGLTPEEDSTYVDSLRTSFRAFSPWEFGMGPVIIDVWVWDQEGNGDFCTVNLSEGTSTSLSCNDNLQVSLGPLGEAVIYPDMITQGYSPPHLTISIDGVNFYPSVLLNCDDIGSPIAVTLLDSLTGNTCWGEINIEDELGPIVVGVNYEHDFTSETETLTIDSSHVISSLFDNCALNDISIEPSFFEVYDLGHNPVVITITDAGGNVTVSVVDVYLTLNGDPFATICVPEVALSTSPWACELESLTASDLYAGNAIHDSSYVSLDNVNFYTQLPDVISGPDTSLTVYVKTIDDGVESYCNTLVTVLDIAPPVVVATQNIEIQLSYTTGQGSAKLYAESVDNGSHDACSGVSLSIEKAPFTHISNAGPFVEFSQFDIGLNKIWLYALDEAGNYNSTWVNVNVIGPLNCNLQSVSLPLPILEVNNNFNVTLSPENLVNYFGYSNTQVEPTWDASCNALLSSYSDIVINAGSSFEKIVRSWTILDWLTGETMTFVQVIKNLNSQYLSCINIATVAPYLTTMQMYASDFVLYSPVGSTLSLVLYNADNTTVPGNLLTQDHLGQTLEYVVTDLTGGSSCSGTLNVSNSIGCPYDESNLDWPDENIYMANPGIDPQTLTPDVLVSDYGFESTEVDVLLNIDSCNLVGYTMSDEIFDLGGGYFNIVRTFLVIDWVSYEVNSNIGIWEFTQVISNNVSPESLICDILPRSAAVGDCDSGHTLDDEVEWPNDLTISDYNITPSELIENSGVNPLDAEPQFYYPENIDKYETEYVDLFVDITATTVEIARVWMVTHIQFGLTWNYSQSIIIDFSEFENLVSVNTISGRAVPNVLVNEAAITNEEGKVIIEEDVNSFSLEDQGMNGINILDYVMIRQYILGKYNLNSDQLIVADMDNNSVVNDEDLIVLKQYLLGELYIGDDNWGFLDRTDEIQDQIKPKGDFMAIKVGDVDDSALFEGESLNDAENTIVVEDLLLNNGQSYNIPVLLEDKIQSRGLSLQLQLDLTKVSVNNIYSNLGVALDYHVSSEGVLNVLLTNDEIFNIGGEGETPMFVLNLTATDNTVLSKSMTLEGFNSFSATSEFMLLVIEGDFNNKIGTGVWDDELSGLMVYPNPAVDYVKIDVSNIDASGDINVTFFNMKGQNVYSQSGENIDLTSLNSGLYIYQVEIDGYKYTDKLNIIK